MPESDGANNALPEHAREHPRAEAENQDPQTAPGATFSPEIGGQEGPEPTRYGDWERNGRCSDF